MPDPPTTPLTDPWPPTGLSAFICFFRWSPQSRQCCPQSLGVGRARGAGHQGTAESPAWVLCTATASGLDSFGADCLSPQVMLHLYVSHCAKSNLVIMMMIMVVIVTGIMTTMMIMRLTVTMTMTTTMTMTMTMTMILNQILILALTVMRTVITLTVQSEVTLHRPCHAWLSHVLLPQPSWLLVLQSRCSRHSAWSIHCCPNWSVAIL